MKLVPITQQHLVVAQKIIMFVQELGWDVDTISIERYDDNDRPFLGKDDADGWKGQKLKWHLRLGVAPRDDDEIKVPVKQIDTIGL